MREGPTYWQLEARIRDSGDLSHFEIAIRHRGNGGAWREATTILCGQHIDQDCIDLATQVLADVFETYVHARWGGAVKLLS
jgi:hypothetical protein